MAAAVSKQEQRERFLARIDETDKNWKFGLADVRETNHWDQDMKAYEACLNATSIADAPWYVVPADSNPQLIICQIILDTSGSSPPWRRLAPTPRCAFVASTLIGERACTRFPTDGTAYS